MNHTRNVYISLGNEKMEDNKIVLGTEEIDLTKTGYLLLEIVGGEGVKWITGRSKPSFEAQITLLNETLQALKK